MTKDKIQKIKSDISKEPKKSKKKKVEQVSLAKTEVGEHLTVITDENGKKTLEWDWDKLSSHVGDAIKAAEKKIAAKEKRKAKKNAVI